MFELIGILFGFQTRDKARLLDVVDFKATSKMREM